MRCPRSSIQSVKPFLTSIGPLDRILLRAQVIERSVSMDADATEGLDLPLDTGVGRVTTLIHCQEFGVANEETVRLPALHFIGKGAQEGGPAHGSAVSFP